MRRPTTSGRPPFGRFGTADVNVLFAVDLFNEGLDIPDIDTLLFLRPTESATLFLQQLGRGLRRTHGKSVLTVLDFVGYHRKEFNFSRKFGVLTGIHGKHLEKAVKEDFPFLPSGCQVRLDKQTQEAVLENLKSQIANRWAQIVAQLRVTKDDSLEAFLESSGLELSDILRRGSHSWTKLRQDAGLETLPGSELEEEAPQARASLRPRGRPHEAAAYRSLLADESPRYAELSPEEQRIARMLYHSFWYDGGGFASIEEGFDAMRQEPAARAEVASVVDLSFEAARHVPVAPPDP